MNHIKTWILYESCLEKLIFKEYLKHNKITNEAHEVSKQYSTTALDAVLNALNILVLFTIDAVNLKIEKFIAKFWLSKSHLICKYLT